MKAALFYADDGLVASIDPGGIQSSFDTLMGLSDWVGLQTDVHKTVGVVFRPFQAARVRADEAYTRWMTGVRRIFK